MLAEWIDRIHYIAQQQRTHPGVGFGDRNNDDEKDEEDDVCYVPSEADDHDDLLNGEYDDNMNGHAPEDDAGPDTPGGDDIALVPIEIASETPGVGEIAPVVPGDDIPLVENKIAPGIPGVGKVAPVTTIE
jgi:hypothetical protein